MFYDLPSPIDFAKNVHECLADDGIWHRTELYAINDKKYHTIQSVTNI